MTASVPALALVSTAFAHMIFLRLPASAGAVNVAPVTILVPVGALLLGTLVLGEVLALQELAGMGPIAIGLRAIDGRHAERLRGNGRRSA